MKRRIAILGLAVAAASLSGCYYDPGYSYVRNNGYQGDVYYGRSAPVYDDGYDSWPGYYGYYGCCYGYGPGVSVGVSRAWYGGTRYRRDGRGGWHGGHAHDRRPAYRGNDRADRADRGRDRGGNRGGSDRRGQDGHRHHGERDHRR